MGYITINQFNKSLDNISKKTLYTNNNCKANLDNLKKIPTDCSKFSFTDFMELLNYQSPTISLKINPSKILYKKGTTLNTIDLLANITKGTNDISKLEFFKDNTLINTIDTAISSGGNFTYTYDTPFSETTIFKGKVTNIKNEIAESSVSISFCNPFYHGIIDNKDNVDVTILTEDLSKKENKKYSYTANNQYCVFILPSEYNLTKIIDMNNFDNTKSFIKTTKEIDGYNYNVYTTKNPVTCNNFSYTFYVS